MAGSRQRPMSHVDGISGLAGFALKRNVRTRIDTKRDHSALKIAFAGPRMGKPLFRAAA